MISKEIVVFTVQTQIQQLIRAKAQQFAKPETQIQLRVFKDGSELMLQVLYAEKETIEILETLDQRQVMRMFNIPLLLMCLKIDRYVINTLGSLIDQKKADWILFSPNEQKAFAQGRLQNLVITDFETAFNGSTRSSN